MYDFDFMGEPITIEPGLADLEAKAAEYLRRVTDTKRFDLTDSIERATLACFLAVQMIRTRAVQNSQKDFAPLLVEKDWVLLQTDRTNPFLMGDHPVAMFNDVDRAVAGVGWLKPPASSDRQAIIAQCHLAQQHSTCLRLAMTKLVDLIWKNAELQRGAFKEIEYRKVILPFTILRRLECVLAPSREAVATNGFATSCPPTAGIA